MRLVGDQNLKLADLSPTKTIFYRLKNFYLGKRYMQKPVFSN